jgi:hypothetical protein
VLVPAPGDRRAQLVAVDVAEVCIGQYLGLQIEQNSAVLK